jgi:hypothetical protein
MGIGAVSLAEARERLVMPFDCGLEGGRIKLSPAVPKSYPIIGARDEEAITTCRPPLASGCRTLMVHRFVISCGGVGVAWMRIVAAIGDGAAGRAWIEDGRLNVALPARNLPDAKLACFDGPPAGGSGLERRVVLMQDCLPWRRRVDFDHVVLPQGFAPVGEFGARLQLVAADTSYSVDEARLDAAQDPALGTVSLPGAGPYDAADESAVAADEWVTIVRAESDFGAGARTGEFPGAWAWFVLALGLATAAAVRARNSFAWSARLFAFAPGMARAFRQQASERWRGSGSTYSNRSLSNAGAAVAAFHVQTEAAVAGLKGAGPLREVLQSELMLVRQRLASVEAAGESGAPAVRTGPHFRALVRELERIRRIADSAAASLSGRRPSTILPRTASEAYDVLGVNADVSEGVLKKIVDALRMSWHPDHARDDDDRRVREGRIRQINAAWELIIAKREVA